MLARAASIRGDTTSEETMCLLQIAQVVSLARDVATLAAIVVGGAWSYKLFIQKRQKYPRAGIEHQIAHKDLGDDAVLLHIAVRIYNVGEVLMSVVCSETRIQQVLPTPTELAASVKQGHDPVPAGQTEVEWPLLRSHKKVYTKGDCEIEPGESHDINHDFIIENGIQTVVIYSYVLNEKKRDRTLAWNLTTLYDLCDTTCKDALVLGRQGSMSPEQVEKQEKPKPRPKPPQDQAPPKRRPKPPTK
jgi:hypothetical protein